MGVKSRLPATVQVSSTAPSEKIDENYYELTFFVCPHT